jgi:hypothetical protein
VTQFQCFIKYILVRACEVKATQFIVWSFKLSIKLVWWGVESNWVHSARRPPMAYCASPWWLWWSRNLWNDWQGKPKYSEKTCPSAALSTTIPTCCPDANPGRRGGKPATNRLNYGKADFKLSKKNFQSALYSSLSKVINKELMTS